MKRYPFAPGVIEGGACKRPRAHRLRRWLVRHTTALGMVLILLPFAAWFLGMPGRAAWLLALASLAGVLGLERLGQQEFCSEEDTL